MHAPFMRSPFGNALPAGFELVREEDLTCAVRSDLCRALSGKWWLERCRELLSPSPPAEVIKRGTYKTLLKCTLDTIPCMVKAYRVHGIMRKVASLIKPSRPAREFLAGCFITAQGIPTATPLAFAERRRWGCVSEGLVIVPFIENAIELREFFFSPDIPAGERHRVAEAFGRLTAEIFARGIFQYDYALNNFLIRREEHGRLYFIDFEKVQIHSVPSLGQRIDILSRLNRVGKEVSVRERLLFVKGYCAHDPGIGSTRTCARELLRATVAALRNDLARKRCTSIYTHARYRRIKRRPYSGLCLSAYATDEVIAMFANIKHRHGTFSVRLQGHELTAYVLNAAEAEKAWAIMNAFVVGGARSDLPEVFIRDAQRGCIGFAPETLRSWRNVLSCSCSADRFVQRIFPEQAHALRALLETPVTEREG